MSSSHILGGLPRTFSLLMWPFTTTRRVVVRLSVYAPTCTRICCHCHTAASTSLCQILADSCTSVVPAAVILHMYVHMSIMRSVAWRLSSSTRMCLACRAALNVRFCSGCVLRHVWNVIFLSTLTLSFPSQRTRFNWCHSLFLKVVDRFSFSLSHE